jgi:hypothetical protein
MSNNPTEIIHGSYHIVEMPDGTEKLVEKLSDNSWAFVDERIKEQQEFDNRFSDTETIPSKWNPLTDVRKATKRQKISTKNHLKAHLVEVFGCPTTIIKNKHLSPDRQAILDKNTMEKATLLTIMKSINDPQWNQVAEIIKSSSSVRSY